MEIEEKKHGKHIYEIRLSLTCYFYSLLFSSKPKNRTNLELDDQSHTRRKQKQSTGVLLKRLPFKIQQIVSCSLATLLKETLSLVSFKDFFKLSSNFTRYIGDLKITYYIEHLLKASLFGFKKILGVDRSSRLEVFCKKGVFKNFK